MGCGSSNNATGVVDDSKPSDQQNGHTAPLKQNGNAEITKAVYPPSEAFEIPLDGEENSDSIIRKHPPKRLQRLVEQTGSPPTLVELEEKLANAEVRRNQILLQRANTLTKAKEDDDENETVEKITEEETKDNSKGEQHLFGEVS